MTVQSGKASFLKTLLSVWVLLFFTGMIFHFRAVSSISTGLLLITGLICYQKKMLSLLFRSQFSPFLLACFLYYVYTGFNLLVKDNSAVLQSQFEMKSALVLVPVAISCTGFMGVIQLRRLMKYFVLILLTASLYCLLMAFNTWIQTGDENNFFYHALVSPLSQHAVFFSFLLFFSLIYILEYGTGIDFFGVNKWDTILAVFFSILLILLSSKLILFCCLLYLLYYFLKNKREKIKRGWLLLIMAFLVLITFTKNPVSNRFREIVQTNWASLDREQFDEADYLNGLQFRYLQWKLVPRILNEKQAWATGLGEEKGKAALQDQFKQRHLYSGQPGTGDEGYLAYNTHNQFLQSLLTGGLAAVFLFLLICVSLLYLIRKGRKTLVTFTIVSLLLFSVTESCFETQYGLLFFTFLPVFSVVLSRQLPGKQIHSRTTDALLPAIE
jgi:O-antigen ligase